MMRDVSDVFVTRLFGFSEAVKSQKRHMNPPSDASEQGSKKGSAILHQVPDDSQCDSKPDHVHAIKVYVNTDHAGCALRMTRAGRRTVKHMPRVQSIISWSSGERMIWVY